MAVRFCITLSIRRFLMRGIRRSGGRRSGADRRRSQRLCAAARAARQGRRSGMPRRRQRRIHRRLGHQSRLRVSRRRPPEDRYVATIRKVGLDLGITQEFGAGLGRLRAGGAARTGRSRRRLRRRARQRLGRHRRRRQRADRRLRQFARAAAAQRAGSGRPQHRGGFAGLELRPGR